MSTSDTVEKVTEVKKGRGRPRKTVDPTTPAGEYRARQAAEFNEKLKKDTVVEKYYEFRGTKLSLCKKKASGTVYKTFIGNTADKKTGADVKAFVDKLSKEGRLKHAI
jgi:hypothetical protein